MGLVEKNGREAFEKLFGGHENKEEKKPGIGKQTKRQEDYAIKQLINSYFQIFSGRLQDLDEYEKSEDMQKARETIEGKRMFSDKAGIEHLELLPAEEREKIELKWQAEFRGLTNGERKELLKTLCDNRTKASLKSAAAMSKNGKVKSILEYYLPENKEGELFPDF